MRRRSRRDADGLARTTPARRVSLAQFRREVVGLLVSGPRFTGERAVRLVAKWDGVVRQRWSQGKPPCNVADHITRYERDGVVCPCGGSGNRDPQGRCRRCRRRLTRKSSARDPECILLDEFANDYGVGDKASLLRKGKPGQSVMCRAKSAKELVDVHPVRDSERRRRRRR